MVRPYTDADLPRVVELANLGWQEIYRMFRECYGEELFRLIVPDPATCKGEQVRSGCVRHPDCVYVYERDGRVLGFVTFRIDAERGIGEIGNNAVDPECRGQGIAQELYAAALQRFRDEGMQFAKVHTGLDWGHAPARRAYEKAGFTIRHEDVDYYQKL